MKKSKLMATAIVTFTAMLSFVQVPLAQHQKDRLGAMATRAGARDEKPIVLTANLVSLTVNVLDANGHSVSGLDKSAFTVLDENVPQEIRYFSNEDSPASVAIVFDVSASMSEAKIQSAKQALAQFIQTSHQDDEFFLISFDSTPHLLLNGVRSGEAVLKKFTYVQTQGNTALYDAVYLGIEKLSQSVFTKRAMILISDGEDNHSLYTFNELRHRLQESDIAIYTVQVGIPLARNGAWNLMGELASASGGKAYSSDSREGMRRSFEQIALELRQQYSLAFFPSGFQADGRKHQLKVQVLPVEGVRRLVVRYRKSYTTFP
jgi:Ca-activated chloride channel family protein